MKPRGKTEEQFDYLMKVIIIGDSGVGKSNMLLRYSEGKFVENYMMTIGINYVYKVVEIEGAKIKLQIWDTAGQDKYKTITKNYYRNSQGVIIVFGIDSRDSFYSVSKVCHYQGNWIEDLSDTMGDSTQVMIVGNKSDLDEKREVTREEAEDLAKHCDMPYMECTANSGQSVADVFGRLAQTMKQKIIDNSEGESQPSNPLGSNQAGNSSNSKCCN